MTNSNYEGIDRQGICGWIELSEELQNGQSAYKLQANRFIQGEEYVTNLISSSFTMELYQFVILNIHFVFTFSKKFKKAL